MMVIEMVFFDSLTPRGRPGLLPGVVQMSGNKT